MCKRCKHCGESNLGVLITQVSTIAARKLNGEIVEFFKESEENTQKEEVNFCFTCNKPITEDDLVETVKCTSCGKEVDHVDGEGLCDECAKVKAEAEAEAKKLASMTQEELIAMIMAQKLGKAPEIVSEPVAESAIEDITKAVEKTEIKETAPVEEKHSEETVEIATEQSEEVKEETTKKKTSRKKAEPAEVKEEEVVTANKEVIEKVSNVTEAKEEVKERVVDAPAPESVDAGKVGIVQDTTAPIDVDTTVDNGSVEDQDILAALNNVKLGDNGIPDIF